MDEIRGGCLCGAVAWTLADVTPFMSHCHCGRCRKAQGAAFVTAISAPVEGLRIVRGRERIVGYESSPGNVRAFCDRCGSTVPNGLAWNGLTFVPAGSFDDDPGVRPVAHIFVASKAPWYEITDAIPRFDAFPPGVEAATFPDSVNPDDGARGPRGSCLCGAVRFVVAGPILRAHHCHCSRCRKGRAAAFATNCFTALDAVEVTAGTERLRTFRLPEARFFGQTFCTTCGSPMPRLDPDRDIAVIPMGALDDDPGVRPMRHIFVASKAPWVSITDDLLRFDGAPPSQ